VVAACRGFHRSYRFINMQDGSHMENTESKGLERKMADGTSGSAEFSGVKQGGTYHYSDINLRFLIFSCLIFESSVDRGIPSFAAAPSGPATFPLLSVSAVSIIFLS
jgi:hypothetical protein